VQIGAQAHFDPVHLLRAGVVQGASEGARGKGLGDIASPIFGKDPEAQVCDLDPHLPILFVHEDVGWLEVSVHEVVRVHDLQRPEEGYAQSGDVLGGERALAQASLERRPGDVLHGEVKMVSGVVPEDPNEVP
jgi:hypothetical protein